MDITLLIVFAVVLLLAGVGLIAVTLRGNKPLRPKNAFEWLSVGMSSLLVIASVVLLALILAEPEREVAFGNLIGPPQDVIGAAVDKPAENLTFRRVSDDAPLNLSDYKGKVVLLNFWATWCIPCLTELPELDRLQQTYGDEGLVVLTVSDEAREDLLEFELIDGMQTVSGYLPQGTELPDMYRRMLMVRPMTYIVDREGIIREAITGEGNFELFSRYVTPYLEADLAQR